MRSSSAPDAYSSSTVAAWRLFCGAGRSPHSSINDGAISTRGASKSAMPNQYSVSPMIPFPRSSRVNARLANNLRQSSSATLQPPSPRRGRSTKATRGSVDAPSSAAEAGAMVTTRRRKSSPGKRRPSACARSSKSDACAPPPLAKRSHGRSVVGPTRRNRTGPAASSQARRKLSILCRSFERQSARRSEEKTIWFSASRGSS